MRITRLSRKTSRRALERSTDKCSVKWVLLLASKTALKQAQKKLETAIKKKEDKSIQKMYAKNVLQARAGLERMMKHKVGVCLIGRPRSRMCSTVSTTSSATSS